MKLDNKNIFCTVSAGYSSVMMAMKLIKWYPNHNIIFAMANTSKERCESLDFMEKCDKYFNLGLVWIEAVINEGSGNGTDFKVVEYADLKRNGEIFEQGIKKYGIPSKINKWCNRELKIVPLKKYADSIFGLNNYSVAIGIRADEIDRVSSSYETDNRFYPLLSNGYDTRLRNKFWNNQPIQIDISAYEGNCDHCFEKSFRKNMTIAIEKPKLSEWWDEMEQKYSHVLIEGKPSYNGYAESEGMHFFRENKSMRDIIEMAKKPFSKATDEYVYVNDLFDYEGDCGGGCQVFI